MPPSLLLVWLLVWLVTAAVLQFEFERTHLLLHRQRRKCRRLCCWCGWLPLPCYNSNAHTSPYTGNGASAAVSVAGVVGYRRRVTSDDGLFVTRPDGRRDSRDGVQISPSPSLQLRDGSEDLGKDAWGQASGWRFTVGVGGSAGLLKRRWSGVGLSVGVSGGWEDGAGKMCGNIRVF